VHVTRLILAIVLGVAICGGASAIEVCEAVVRGDLVITTRSVPESKTKTVTATRMVDVGGRAIPETVMEEVTFTEMVPVQFEEPLAAYRISNAGGDEVGARTVHAALAKTSWVVVLTDGLPANQRAVFKPDTLFFESKLRLIDRVIESLDAREAEILRLRYAGEQGAPLTDKELARSISVTPDELRAVLRTIEEKLGFTLPPPERE
jgi:DNA-binding CsgD family transcriptional regulator